MASPSAAASVATQADSLRTLTARLKDAYNGVEVQWLDTEGKGELSNTFNSIGIFYHHGGPLFNLITKGIRMKGSPFCLT